MLQEDAWGRGAAEPPRFPARPGCAPKPRGGPQRYPLVDPAGLLMLAVPGRSGWWALPESRPAAPASPPGAAALQPPGSSLRGSRAGQVGGGGALRSSPSSQNSFHGGNRSIFKFLPGSSKNRSCWSCCCSWLLLDMDTRMDRQMERDRQTDRSRREEDSRRSSEGQRDEDRKTAFLGGGKGASPLSPHPGHSVFGLERCYRGVQSGQVSAARCSSTQDRRHGWGLRGCCWARRRRTPAPAGRAGTYGHPGREAAAGSRLPSRAAQAAAKGPRSSSARDFVPVAAGWVPL